MERYEKYKDSGIEWIGYIPEHWGRNKLSYCFDKIGSGTTPKSTNQDYYFNGKFNWLQTGDLNDGDIINTSKKITQKALDDYSTLRFYPKESIVIAMYGATIGKMGLLNIETTTNQACCVLAEPKNIISKFVFYWFQSIKKHIISISYGGGQPNINQEQIRTLQIQLPPKQEQTKIANYLDKKNTEINELITQKETLLNLYEEEKTAIINQAVTKGINPKVKLKDSGIDWLGEIPVHWEVKKLNYVSNVQTGRTPKIQGSKIDFFMDGEINWYTPADFNGYEPLINSKRKIITNAVKSNQVELFPENSIYLVSIGATLGKVSISKSIASANQQINIISFEPKDINPFFGYYFLVGNKEMIIYEADFTTLPILNQSKLKNLLIVVPSITEQTQIVNYIETETTKINTKVTNTKKLITLLKEYKTALISEVVTGKIKIN